MKKRIIIISLLFIISFIYIIISTRVSRDVYDLFSSNLSISRVRVSGTVKYNKLYSSDNLYIYEFNNNKDSNDTIKLWSKYIDKVYKENNNYLYYTVRGKYIIFIFSDNKDIVSNLVDKIK